MGVIQIRARSERLGNLGSVTPPTLETGEAGYWNAVGRGIQALGSAGMEIAGFLARQKRERDETAVNDAVAEYQSRMAVYDADRAKNPIDGAATDAWVDENVAWRDELKEHIKDGRKLSEDQFRAFNRRVVGYDISTQNRWQTRATATRNDYDVARTGASLKAAIDNAVADGADQTAWLDVDGALAANISALERKSGRAFSPEERLALTKETLMRAQTARYDFLMANTADSDDPDTVRKDWDALRASLDERGWTTETDAILAGRGGKLTEADGAALRAHFEACAEKAEANAHRRQAEGWARAREEAVRRENDILSRPQPETAQGRAAADAETLRDYRAIAADERLSTTERNRYARIANAMELSIAKADAAEKKAVMKEARAKVREERDRRFEIDYAELEATGRWGGRDVSSDEICEIATTGLESGRYDIQQFRRLRAIVEKKWDDETATLRDHVVALCERVAPRIAYRDRENRFVFTGKGKERDTMSSGIPFRFGTTKRDKQESTYAELLRAMNMAVAEWRRRNLKSAAEAIAYFDDLVSGTVRAQQQETIRENLDYDKRLERAKEGK